MTRALDLGCGDKPRNPFHADVLHGVDVRDKLGAHIRQADLVVEVIPYDDAFFDYVTAYDFIEHVPRVIYLPQRRNAFVELMNEVHRVLKPGGLFLSQTPAYPHGEAFRDPTHVNIITDQTLPQYFDDQTRCASIYGFRGAFKVLSQRWQGPHLVAVLQKCASPERPAPAVPGRACISVLIPVYNGARRLAATLDSALAQTDPDFELLCIDDASTDGSAAILHEYAARDPRVRVLALAQNQGCAPKALNHALPLMRGGYCVYSSQDDLYSPDWLASMRARAIETGADAVIPEVVLHHADGPARDRILANVAGDRGAVLGGRAACRLSLDWSIPGNALWNAQLVRELGFEEFAVNADEYSVRRFFLQCDKVAFSGGRFYYRQDNPDAVTRRLSPATFDWPLTRLRVAEMLQEHGFDGATVRREADAARRDMDRLRRVLEEWRGRWSAQQVERAEAAVLRFEQRCGLQAVFAPPPPRASRIGRYVRKWKNSLRKLPHKLGLARSTQRG